MKKEKFPYYLFDSPEIDSTIVAMIVFSFMLCLMIFLPLVTSIIISLIIAIISYLLSYPLFKRVKRKYSFWARGGAG